MGPLCFARDQPSNPMCVDIPVSSLAVALKRPKKSIEDGYKMLLSRSLLGGGFERGREISPTPFKSQSHTETIENGVLDSVLLACHTPVRTITILRKQQNNNNLNLIHMHHANRLRQHPSLNPHHHPLPNLQPLRSLRIRPLQLPPHRPQHRPPRSSHRIVLPGSVHSLQIRSPCTTFADERLAEAVCQLHGGYGEAVSA